MRSECDHCTRPATWILNVQWGVLDLDLETFTCNYHLMPATTYWQRRTVDDPSAVITQQSILETPILVDEDELP